MGVSHTTRRLVRPLALALVLAFVGSASPNHWEGAQARLPHALSAPQQADVIVEPAASATVIVPGSAPAPPVQVVATGASASVPAPATLADVLLNAYRSAVAGSPTGCHLPVSLLAAIGEVESGSLVGRSLDRQHRTSVLGPVLDGHGFAAVADTDGGHWDGNTRWDRAVGPMQFLPGTWKTFGTDGDGDGVANPQDVEDAAASTADYLCFGGRDLSDPESLRQAVLSYNHSTAYLDLVTTYAARFAGLGLDDAGTPGLPTQLSLVASVLPGEAPTAAGNMRTHHHGSGLTASTALTHGAAPGPQMMETSAGLTPVPAVSRAAAAMAIITAGPVPLPLTTTPTTTPAVEVKGPTTGPSPSTDPSPSTKPDPSPSTDPPPSTKPDPSPSTDPPPSTKPDPSPATDPSPAPVTCPTAPVDPTPPAASPTPVDVPSLGPCDPCPTGVDPTPQQPCLPAAKATDPAPSSAP